MARGKYADKARLKRESDEVHAEIETYQRNVARLTKENRDLKEQLAKAKRTHRDDVKALKAQLAEGLTPELLALRRKLDEQVERANAAQRSYADLQKRWDRIGRRMHAMLMSRFGLTGTEAVDALLYPLGPDDARLDELGRVETASTAHTSARKLGGQGQDQLARARGERRSS